MAGSVLLFSARLVQQGIYVARLIILGRILSPHDFGLMGVIFLIMATMDTFSRTGFDTALIQRKGEVREYLNSAWTVQVARGMFLSILLMMTSTWAAAFFHVPEVTPMLQLAAWVCAIRGLQNIGIVYFQKEMSIGRQCFMQCVGIGVDFTVSVASILVMRNAWALVLGFVAGEIAKTILSYAVHPYRPRFCCECGKLGELLGFGKWVLGSGILVFMVTQGDDIVVGKFLGAAALGLYQMAYRIANVPATEITHVLSQVTVPAYAQLQDCRERLIGAFKKIMRITLISVFLLSAILWLVIDDAVRFLLGGSWSAVVPLVQLLLIAGLLRALAAAFGFLFYALGKPQVDTRVQIVRLFLLAILIFPCMKSAGLIGVVIAVIASTAVTTALFMYYSLRLLNIRLGELCRVLIVPAAQAGSAAAVLFILKQIFGHGYASVTTVVILGLAFGTVYVCAVTRSWRKVSCRDIPVSLEPIGT